MKLTLLFFLVAVGCFSCTLPPINFYHVSTGYFITDENAEAYMDKKIELYVTDPKTETTTTQETK
jgi:hypothetical protein